MVTKRTTFDLVFDIILYVFLILLGILFLYPMWHVVMASFSDPGKLIQHSGPMLLPTGFSTLGYQSIFRNVHLWRGYGNTILYTVLGTGVSMVMTILGAYVLSRRDFMLKKFMTIMVVISMYIGGGLIPTFLVVKGIGLYNSIWAVIIPGCISTWNMIVMRTAFRSSPPSLEESARIDGANDFTVLFRIILPTVKANTMVIGLFYAVGQWNSWFGPMIYFRDRAKYPLALILRELLNTASLTSGGALGDVLQMSNVESISLLGESIKYSTIVVATLPILCLYPFVQKYFVTGVMMGSLKE